SEPRSSSGRTTATRVSTPGPLSTRRCRDEAPTVSTPARSGRAGPAGDVRQPAGGDAPALARRAHVRRRRRDRLHLRRGRGGRDPAPGWAQRDRLVSRRARGADPDGRPTMTARRFILVLLITATA